MIVLIQSTKLQRQEKIVVNEWCDFLIKIRMLLQNLHFVQECHKSFLMRYALKKNLKKLYIKWGVYPDISKISNLVNLEFLHLGSGSSVGSIEPISKLENLVALNC